MSMENRSSTGVKRNWPCIELLRQCMWRCSFDYWKEFDNSDTRNSRSFVHTPSSSIELQRVRSEWKRETFGSNNSLTATEEKHRYVRIHAESTVFFECKWTISMICFYLSFIFSIFFLTFFSLLAEEFGSKRKPTQRRWSVDLTLKKLLAEKKRAEKWKQMFEWSALNTDVCWSSYGQDDGQANNDQHRLSPRVDVKRTWRAVASIAIAAAIHIECRSTKVITRLCTLTNAGFVHVNTTGWNVTSHFHARAMARIVGETIQIGRFRAASRERRCPIGRRRRRRELLTNSDKRSTQEHWKTLETISAEKTSRSFVRSLSYRRQWSA